MLSKSRLTNYKNQIHTQNTKIAELKGLQSMGKLKPKQLKELKKAESSVRSLQKTQKSIVKSYAKKSAKINKLSFRNEFVYVFSHGVLHLLGFDHEEEMFSIQDRVVLKIK